jgi:hypothetical protein
MDWVRRVNAQGHAEVRNSKFEIRTQSEIRIPNAQNRQGGTVGHKKAQKAQEKAVVSDHLRLLRLLAVSFEGCPSFLGHLDPLQDREDRLRIWSAAEIGKIFGFFSKPGQTGQQLQVWRGVGSGHG